MATVLVPDTSNTTETSEYDYRVLYLSGTWTNPVTCEFRFRSTIFVQSDGAAEGSIYWQAIRAHGVPRSYFGTESVRGCVSGRDVDLRGYATEPGLAVDWYKIYLAGSGEAGSFGGRSASYKGDWRASMDGQYLFRNRKG